MLFRSHGDNFFLLLRKNFTWLNLINKDFYKKTPWLMNVFIFFHIYIWPETRVPFILFCIHCEICSIRSFSLASKLKCNKQNHIYQMNLTLFWNLQLFKSNASLKLGKMMTDITGDSDETRVLRARSRSRSRSLEILTPRSRSRSRSRTQDWSAPQHCFIGKGPIIILTVPE